MNWQGVDSKEEGLAPPLRTLRTVKFRGQLAVAEREGRGRVRRRVAKKKKKFMFVDGLVL